MTTQKTFKRRVRARAARTGESYSAARAQLLRKATQAAPPDAAPGEAAVPEVVDAEALTGMSDDAMRRGSGRPIAEWLGILDAWGAREHSHTEIARWLVAEHGIGGWWAQSVTVAYERARGMRQMHQRPGGFTVGISRTIRATGEQVTDAFTDESVRRQWLPDAPMRVRTSQPGRSARFDWDDPPSLLALYTVPKGDRTQVTVQFEKLPDADSVERVRSYWRDALGRLKEVLERT